MPFILNAMHPTGRKQICLMLEEQSNVVARIVDLQKSSFPGRRDAQNLMWESSNLLSEYPRSNLMLRHRGSASRLPHAGMGSGWADEKLRLIEPVTAPDRARFFRRLSWTSVDDLAKMADAWQIKQRFSSIRTSPGMA